MKEKTYIYLSRLENSAVQIAARNLAKDIEKVSAYEVALRDIEDLQGAADHTPQKGICIASMGICEQMREWFPGKLPDTRPLKDADGKARWEAFLHRLCGEMLYIIGSDKRGTVYGIYGLSEQIGVSPWYFWADVPPKKDRHFSLPKDYFKVDWPSVPYRGIFLNDEEELEAWAKEHTGDDTIGPETYEKIYELILRLRGNYIWPAMHVNYFNQNPENRRLAGETGIVVGTSHCDMMMRSNQNEWAPWLAQKGYQGVKYDYSIPGKNRRILQEYWTESAEMYKDHDASYTVGMRGIHDSGFVTQAVDQDQRLTSEQRVHAKVELLENVIEDQRQILREVLGNERGSKALQLFIPYKEVLDLYDSGLALPEDVTTIWVDDNFGYMRRYPNQEELRRSGGHGLYYHASYWAPPGLSYLFFNSIPLAHTGNELKKCYESGIQKVWVLNIGALKPLEVDMEFFLRYGWEAGKSSGETKDASVFMENWFNRNFSGGFGSEAADIYCRFTQLTNVCKLEHMRSGKFSQTAYGDEAERRMLALKDLLQRADRIYRELPEEEKDACFQVFYMKLEASYAVNASFYYADRSRLSYNRGAMQAADTYLALSRQMDERKRSLIYHYNHTIQNGKWNGILTPESFLPPPMVLYPAAKPALMIGEPGLGIVPPKQEIVFSRYGEAERYLELFNHGCGAVSFQIVCPDWLQAVPVNGEVRSDQKVRLCFCAGREDLFETGQAAEIKVLGGLGEQFSIPVRAACEPAVSGPAMGPCYMEADGYVSIPADGFVEQRDTPLGTWRKVLAIGRGEGNAMECYMQAPTRERPTMTYGFYLYSSGAFLLEIHRFLTLNATGRIGFSVSVDDLPFIPVESATTDEWRGNWEDAVMNNGEKLCLRLPYLEPGPHRLTIGMAEQYVTLTKLVLYTKERIRSNFGPPTSSFWNGAGFVRRTLPEDRTIFYTDAMTEDYAAVEKVPLLPMLYADPQFRSISRLYVRSDEREQTGLGERRYLPDSHGRKNVFEKFREGPYQEHNGRIKIEAEYALLNRPGAYLTRAMENPRVFWSHTQAETDGGTGLAMMIEGENIVWENPAEAPGMHYRVKVSHPGKYHVWLLLKFEDMKSDACVLALDGVIQDRSQQFCKGNLFCYSMKQRWNWQAISDMELAEGDHIFSIMGRKSGLRVDRIYITSGSEWPPIDSEWDDMQL